APVFAVAAAPDGTGGDRLKAGTQPDASMPAIRTKFENGDSVNDLFTALSLRFNVIVVQVKPAKAFILKNFELPEKLDDAVALARQNLEPQGYGMVESVNAGQVILRVVSAKDAKAAELSDSPVTYGTATEKIDTSKPERQVTHLLPITHPEMIDKLHRIAVEDNEVSAEVMGNSAVGLSLVFTGPAKKVQHAVDAVIKVDEPDTWKLVARMMTLKHFDAEETADRLNRSFATDPAPMKAVADKRTNSIVITGPEDRVMNVMVDLIGLETTQGPMLPKPPATVPEKGP
ncbi:MAG TPA: hypothetical protein VGN88_07770, partial [Phycisphaerae bacterium]